MDVVRMQVAIHVLLFLFETPYKLLCFNNVNTFATVLMICVLVQIDCGH